MASDFTFPEKSTLLYYTHRFKFRSLSHVIDMNHLIFAPYCVRVTSSVTTRTDIIGQKKGCINHALRENELIITNSTEKLFRIALK